MNARPYLVITLILSFLGIPSVAPAQQETVADYTAIAQPTIAGKLSLSDEQRARVAKLLDDRLQALEGASPADRSKIIQDSNQKISELLTPEQKAIFTALASRGQLRFNFRKQKWADVLDWFARQSKLSLVMDTTPEGTFTYSDSKDYSPAEAIDLLNSVLQTKGFTLLRKNGILLVGDTSEGIPFEMTPKVTAPGLLDRGRFEIVTLELPIGTRDPTTCLETVRELIGPNGRVIPLGNAKKLLVTDTAGKLLAINEAVSAISLPKSAPKPKPAPKPVLAVYAINGLDADATVETLQALFSSGTIRADASAEEIHVYATPATQTGVKASVDKMLDAISDRRKPQLQIYPVESKTPAHLVDQLLIAAPKAQVTFDESRSRLLVVANAEQQESVQATIKKLGADGAQALAEDNVVIYPIQPEATESLTTLLQAVIPRALVVAQPGRIAVRGRPHEQKAAKATFDLFQELKKSDEMPTLKLYTFEKELDNELVESIRATVPDATLTRLAEGKRLYALAKVKDQALIAATLKQLETDLPLAAAQKLQVYSLEEMESEEVETLLSSIVPGAQVRSDSTGKRLLIWALAKEHEVISTTLAQLKENLPQPDTKKLQV